MASGIPEIQPPLVSAFFMSIQLLSEQSDLEVATLDERRQKGQQSVDAKVEQQWNLQASLGEAGSERPVLLVEVSLEVKVSDQTSGVRLGSYACKSRARFDVVGMVGKITSEELPSAAIAPYLVIASDRVRTRCHNNFSAMNLPVRIPSPRDFTAVQAIAGGETAVARAAPKATKRKRTKGR